MNRLTWIFAAVTAALLLAACGDVPLPEGGVEAVCGDVSNTASATCGLPAGALAVERGDVSRNQMVYLTLEATNTSASPVDVLVGMWFPAPNVCSGLCLITLQTHTFGAAGTTDDSFLFQNGHLDTGIPRGLTQAFMVIYNTDFDSSADLDAAAINRIDEVEISYTIVD